MRLFPLWSVGQLTSTSSSPMLGTSIWTTVNFSGPEYLRHLNSVQINYASALLQSFHLLWHAASLWPAWSSLAILFHHAWPDTRYLLNKLYTKGPRLCIYLRWRSSRTRYTCLVGVHACMRGSADLPRQRGKLRGACFQQHERRFTTYIEVAVTLRECTRETERGLQTKI